jgi:proline iminopeptidase
VYGADDIRPAWPTEQLSQLLPAARFILLQGADHNLWQQQPLKLQQIIYDFLAEFC